MKYILYQAYGKIEIINEAIFSILSLLKFYDNYNPPFSIIIYTDNKPAFQKYFSGAAQIEYRIVNSDEIKIWKGEIDFVHRVKIKIIQDFFENHPKANLLYLDTDTYFTTAPNTLFDIIATNQPLMHVNEGKISARTNPVFKKLDKFLKQNPGFQLPSSTEMWNAGVLGLTEKDKPLLDKVSTLTDTMYALHPKHVIEQLAFSYYLALKASITPSNSAIYHYWDFKEFRQNIASFLEDNKGLTLSELSQKTSSLPPYEVQKTIKTKTKKKIFSLYR